MVKLSTLYSVLLVVFLISLYTSVPLYIGVEGNSFYIPSVFVLLVMVPLVFVTLNGRIYRYDVAFLAIMSCVLLLTALLSPGLDFLGQKLLGFAQTTTSLVTGVLLLRLLDRVGRRKVAKILFVLSLVFVVGSLLEVVGVLREVSDSFREAAYSNSPYNVYDDPLRDASITGFERASFFASEPSVLAKGFLAFVNSWLLLCYGKRNFLVTLLLTAVLFVVTGSPVLVVSAAISLAIAATGERRFRGLLAIATFLSLAGLMVLLINPDVVYGLIQRFQYVSSIGLNSNLLVRDSIGLRLVLPALTLVDVWGNSPLFGVGISGKEVAESYMNFYIPPTIIDYGSNIGFANNFMAALIYLGLVGIAMFVVTLVWYFRKLGIRSVLLLFFIVVAFSFTGGGFEEARTWGYVFLLVWAVKIRDEAVSLDLIGRERPVPYPVGSIRPYRSVDRVVKSNYVRASPGNNAA